MIAQAQFTIADLSDATVIIVEDIIDSGRTLAYLTDYLRLGGAKCVRTCTLLAQESVKILDILFYPAKIFRFRILFTELIHFFQSTFYPGRIYVFATIIPV